MINDLALSFSRKVALTPKPANTITVKKSQVLFREKKRKKKKKWPL
jgi:hypothetical protein